jgi:hypothetical protein
MYKYEELLEKIRKEGPVDKEEISKETHSLARQLDDLRENLTTEPDSKVRMEIIDKMLVILERMSGLDSLNKAMCLYELELENKKIWGRLLGIFRR